MTDRKTISDASLGIVVATFIWYTIAISPAAGQSVDKSVAYSPAQIAGGYAGVAICHIATRELLRSLGDFPSPSLSSLTVVVTSLGVSAGSSMLIYVIGGAFESDVGSPTRVILSGMATVGGCALAGVLIGQDDWKLGAAIGSVLGCYLVPIVATASYHAWKPTQGARVDVPSISFRF